MDKKKTQKTENKNTQRIRKTNVIKKQKSGEMKFLGFLFAAVSATRPFLIEKPTDVIVNIGETGNMFYKKKYFFGLSYVPQIFFGGNIFLVVRENSCKT